MKEKKNIRSIRDIVASMLGRRKGGDVVRMSARNVFVPRYMERYSGIPIKDTMKRILLGNAVGDALGYTVQFLEREKVQENPVKEMSRGMWSDDTSLSLCLADSLCGGYDLEDVAKRFIAWFQEGFWTPYGRAFDIGATTRRSMAQLIRGIAPAEAGMNNSRDNGNGSLMRIAPLIPFAYGLVEEQQNRLIEEVSSLTHRHPRAILACIFYCKVAFRYLDYRDLGKAFTQAQREVWQLLQEGRFCEETEHFGRLLKLSYEKFRGLEEEEIRSSGYVIDSLEASLWCVFKHDNFKETVLRAVNLGGDADTIGAIAGALAGIVYGCEAMPKEWVNKLERVEDIVKLAERYDKLARGM